MQSTLTAVAISCAHVADARIRESSRCFLVPEPKPTLQSQPLPSQTLRMFPRPALGCHSTSNKCEVPRRKVSRVVSTRANLVVFAQKAIN